MMKTLRVLLLDDVRATNYIHRKYLEQTLPQSEVVAFQKGQDALDHLASLEPREFPHWCFIDINMPSMNGWTFFQKWLDRNLPIPGHTRVFVLTTSVTPVDQARLQQFDFVSDIIYKPLHPKLIVNLFDEYSAAMEIGR